MIKLHTGRQMKGESELNDENYRLNGYSSQWSNV